MRILVKLNKTQSETQTHVKKSLLFTTMANNT